MVLEVNSFNEALVRCKDALTSKLLENISVEFKILMEQLKSKENEIARLESYAGLLKDEIDKLSSEMVNGDMYGK